MQRMMNLADPWLRFFAAGKVVEVCPCRDNAVVHRNTSCLPS